MGIKYEVSAKAGTYKDRDGNEKTRYVKMGVVLETRNGFALKLEAIPVGFDGWAYLNEPKPREGGKPQMQSAPASGDGFEDDDIPF